ncbi:GNAT family N-acetyltransferase [Chryseobacterium sp. SSA4.19]|uniref:GNAT family N-acetyltransferase n=1 Tax=Chryseobacterium sp. SSA4.19 TaxID=2919915 RepID=UPI001F4ED2BC|nr:GNAT family N-acetyltransferase [Chryseobacterium sp. SSA4.19]MCJ8153400.1 GNAT family N-acetyltransferase [Chryseobacterium sp. SSA4.19]
MASINIRKASADELETLQALARETFYETFAKDNAEDEMQTYLDESFSTGKLLQELNTANSHFFIAWEDQDPIGYLKVNTGNAQTELQDETSIEIERIYVKSSHHGKKVGQLLYDKALESALQENKKYLWLGVWEENLRAVTFYKKNGFVTFDQHIFRLGSEQQTDLMMRKDLE